MRLRSFGLQKLGTRARRGLVAGVLAASAVGMLTAPGLESVRMALADGTAWLMRGPDMAHASSSTGEADWLVPDVVDEDAAGRARLAQDGDLTLVVDPVGGRSLSVDAVTLEVGEVAEVDDSAVPFVGGGQAYLVSDGEISWLDPATFETRETIRVPGRVRATIDGGGILWAVTPRDGMLRRVRHGEVTHEVRATSPGHDVAVSLAAGRPVVHDLESRELWFVDRRDAELSDPVTLPEGSQLQGPSELGGRAWAVTGDRLLGVSADGETIETRLPGSGTPHRPEVIDGRVVVPTHEGTLTVVDETDGRVVTETPRPLPAATHDDFQTFVKDGVLWFNAPQAEMAGTVAPDGSVEVLEVDEDGLRTRQEGQPEPDDPVNPNQVAAPPSGAPPASSPSPTSSGPRPSAPAPPTQVQPAPPSPPPTSPPAPAPSSTTTTRPTTTTGPQPVTVADVANQNVDQACATLQQQGLQCTRAASGQFAEPAQVVLSQTPAAGTSVARGTPVTVTFHESAGVVVPQAGDRRANACAPIEAAGLYCNPIAAPSSDPVQPEGVHAQSPAPGARVGPGATVNVTYDNRSWGTVYQFDDPGSARLVLSTDANAAPGWPRTRLGRVFLEQAPGTVPVYCWQPNGDGANLSHTYQPGGDDDLDGYHQRCAATVLGYGPQHAALTNVAVPIHAYVGHSDWYYSLSANDPNGQALVATDPDGYSDVRFNFFVD